MKDKKLADLRDYHTRVKKLVDKLTEPLIETPRGLCLTTEQVLILELHRKLADAIVIEESKDA